jgi:poly-gamma-glutamate synthesis protein (capsule biosynthesis protein)
VDRLIPSKYKLLALFAASIVLIMIAVYLGLNSDIFKLGGNNDSPFSSPEPALKASQTPSPTPEPTPEPAPLKAVLVSAGDCVLHEAFQQSALVNGEDRYDFTDIFSAIKPYTEAADYSLISFESAATNKRDDYSGYPTFNCPPEIFDAFKETGFDLVNNSNNHQLDRRLSGMLETRDNIRSRGIEVIGAYDGEEPRYMIKDLNGIKVGIMAYTYSCNMNENALSPEQQKKHLALIDEVRMKKEISEMEQKADVSVVAMHWGTEYTQKPTDYQKKLAHEMISWGADVILGSHPHVVQPSETVELNGETKYIIYSMGNFVSNQRRGASGYPKTHKELSEDSMLVNILFSKDPKTQKTVVEKVDHIPTWLWRYEKDGGFQFRVIPVPSPGFYKNGEYPKEALAEAYESYKRTMSLVTDYPESK